MTQKTNPTENSSSEKPKRKRGAPPGNKNALKHGFYAANFNENDLDGPNSDIDRGLQDEITMLRVYMRFVLSFGYQVKTVQEAMECLRTISLASTALARLIKIQKQVFGVTNEFDIALQAALAQVQQELNLE
jgi:hypothetical protein